MRAISRLTANLAAVRMPVVRRTLQRWSDRPVKEEAPFGAALAPASAAFPGCQRATRQTAPDRSNRAEYTSGQRRVSSSTGLRPAPARADCHPLLAAREVEMHRLNWCGPAGEGRLLQSLGEMCQMWHRESRTRLCVPLVRAAFGFPGRSVLFIIITAEPQRAQRGRKY